jgi:hypothetical protein
MRVLAILALLPLLSGCLTLAEIAERQAQQDDSYCKSIGLNFGTGDYANCRLTLTQARQVQQAQAEANATAMLAAGAAVMASQPPPPPVQPLPNILPQQTRCATYGANTNCTTY